MSKGYRIHPLAKLFPPMPDDEYRHLRDDIRSHGLREPVTLLDGQILDGVHRHRACQDLGVDAETKPFAGGEGHSTKPPEFYELVESCSPGPRLEMFARGKRPGWMSWGADA